MQPFNENVLIKRIELKKRKSGIILTDTDPMATYHYGIIYKLPSVDRKEARDLKVGDKVIYMHHNANRQYEGYEIVPFKEIILKDNSIKDGQEENQKGK